VLCDVLVSLERMCALTLTPRGLTVTRARGILPGPTRRGAALARSARISCMLYLDIVTLEETRLDTVERGESGSTCYLAIINKYFSP